MAPPETLQELEEKQQKTMSPKPKVLNQGTALPSSHPKIQGPPICSIDNGRGANVAEKLGRGGKGA